MYLDWLENIRPWCISRQLWWGHQLPVWYRGDETYVGDDAARGRGLGARPRRARHVVLLGAVAVRDARLARARRRELRAFYPTDVLVTARDILFLWVARMVMMGLEFAGDVPFDDVYIHSVIQAPDGRRMSKSLGHRASTRSTRSRRTAPTRCASACWRCPRPRTCATRAEKVAQGQALAQQALERVAADPARRRRRRASRSRGRATVEDRWILSRLQRARRRAHAQRSRRFDFATPRSGSTTSSTASCATGTSSSSRPRASTTPDLSRDAAATCCARRSRSRTR